MSIEGPKAESDPEKEEPEKILSAALLYKGHIITGDAHGDAAEWLEANAPRSAIAEATVEFGFKTTKGRFVNDTEAMIIAKREKQLVWGHDKKALDSAYLREPNKDRF